MFYQWVLFLKTKYFFVEGGNNLYKTVKSAMLPNANFLVWQCKSQLTLKKF